MDFRSWSGLNPRVVLFAVIIMGGCGGVSASHGMGDSEASESSNKPHKRDAAVPKAVVDEGFPIPARNPGGGEPSAAQHATALAESYTTAMRSTERTQLLVRLDRLIGLSLTLNRRYPESTELRRQRVLILLHHALVLVEVAASPTEAHIDAAACSICTARELDAAGVERELAQAALNAGQLQAVERAQAMPEGGCVPRDSGRNSDTDMLIDEGY